MRRLTLYAQRLCGLGERPNPRSAEPVALETAPADPSALLVSPLSNDHDEMPVGDSLMPLEAPVTRKRSGSLESALASRPEVEYHGRWSKDGYTRTAGASMHFRTSSPRVTLTFGRKCQLISLRRAELAEPTIVWTVDGEEHGHMVATRHKQIVLYDVNVVDEVLRRDGEKDFDIFMVDPDGKLHVQAIDVVEGHPLLPPSLAAKPATKILYIGDSLTSGFNPMFAPEALPLVTYQAYPVLLARSLRSAGHNIHTSIFAYPGIKLASIKTRYNETLGINQKFFLGWAGDGDDNAWEDETDIPNVVFINIGTNDRGTFFEEDLFLGTYKAFIEAVRDAAGPSLRHIVIISPFGVFRESGRWTIYEPAVLSMVFEVQDEWEKEGATCKIWHVDTEGWVTRNEMPDGLHPDAKGHEMIVTRLEDWARETGVLGQI